MMCASPAFLTAYGSSVAMRAVFAAAVCAVARAGSPWAGSDAVPRAAAIVSKMSLDDKLSMIWGRNKLPPNGPLPKKLYYVGNVPALPRYGLPSINLEDGPQGVADGLTNITQWSGACATNGRLQIAIQSIVSP